MPGKVSISNWIFRGFESKLPSFDSRDRLRLYEDFGNTDLCMQATIFVNAG